MQRSEIVAQNSSGTFSSNSSFEARIDGSSGQITITLPEGVGARVALDSGSGAFRPDARFTMVSGERARHGGGGDGVWETENLDTAEYTIELEIDQGSGAIIIEK